MPFEFQALNLPPYPFKIREATGYYEVFDELRKKFIVLTPEEWVRQHLIQFLIKHKNYPKGMISVEKGLNLYERKKRTDVLVYNKHGEIVLLIECKSPEISMDQSTFDQASRYNHTHRAPYLMISNGIQHYACRIDHLLNSYELLSDIPSYEELR